MIFICQAVKSLKRPVIFPDGSQCIEPRRSSLPLLIDLIASLFWTAQVKYRNRLASLPPDSQRSYVAIKDGNTELVNIKYSRLELCNLSRELGNLVLPNGPPGRC